MTRWTRRAGLAITLVASLAASPFAAPTPVAAAADDAITWTVDHAAQRIDVLVRLELYSGCTGDPEGDDDGKASACQLPGSMLAGPTQLLAEIIRRKIERVWNKPYHYRCYELHFEVDITVGTDQASVPDDRIGVRIDPSPAGIRAWVAGSGGDGSTWRSDNPTDRYDPGTGPASDTSWPQNPRVNTINTYAHEFGHILGLDDAYRDVIDPGTGKPVSAPYHGAPLDLMSDQRATISQETIDRLVKRNMPRMEDTQGNPVTDEDLVCDWEGDMGGRRISGVIRYCGAVEHPYWGFDVVSNVGDRSFVAFDIPPGSTEPVRAVVITPFVVPQARRYVEGTGAFVPGDPGPAHFALDIGDGFYLVELRHGNFCRVPVP